MRPEPLETTLERAKRLGYSSVELAGEPDLYRVAETRNLLLKYQLECWGTVTMMHGDRDLTAADPEKRRASVQYVKKVVMLCAALGGKVVTVVPAKVGKLAPTSSSEDEWRWAVEGLREIAALAQEKEIRMGIEPLNRFETYFINRTDQALAMADEVGYGCGVAFDPFHLGLEEQDLFAAMRACGSRIVDFHVADHNRLAAGDGAFDWAKMMAVLAEVGYDGGLAFEASPPIDRTPRGRFGAQQLEAEVINTSSDLMEFILAHGSGVLSDAYYSELLRRTAETLRPFVNRCIDEQHNDS